jgi:titin
LAWTDNAIAPNNEDGFVIERSTDGGTNWSSVGQTAADIAAFSDTNVVPGSSYLYQVYAFNANGNSSSSNSVQADVPNVIPADPTNLSATTVASTQTNLAWTDNSNNEDGFRIERSDNGGSTWNQVGQTAANVTTFNNTGLTPATGYMYRVYAFNAVGDSANPAGPIAVTTTTGTPPAAPSNLVSAPTQSSLTLSWTDNSGNEDGFTVQIATDKNFSQSSQSFNVGPDVTQYMFYPLAPNTKYYMRVAAFNAAGASAWSPVLTDKTLR